MNAKVSEACSARNVAGVLVAMAVLAIFAVAAVGYTNATADPVVRVLTIRVSDYPRTAAPLRLVLFSDLHVRGPDMQPSRVAHIVDRINALHPDIDVVAGDFRGNSLIGVQYSPDETTQPLRRLKAKLGVYAVLGNNDSNVSAATVRGLEEAGVRVLMNEAVPLGPIALGGIDGRLAHSEPELDDARRRTYTALLHTPGIKVLVGHRPDEFVAAPQFISLVLAGHTHCGQIVLPVLGALATGSDYGQKYACGIFRNGSKVLVVTAGLGTSHLPLRIGAPPDIWLIVVRGADGSRSGNNDETNAPVR